MEPTKVVQAGEGIWEVRWHARAGQGAVTAAKALAELALREGKYIQASPEYGPERAGAPMRAYNRVADAPLRLYNQVTTPDAVVVIDHTLLDVEDVLEGTPEDALILVNTATPPERVRRRLGAAGRHFFTVDATRIALDELGRAYPNMPMLGALVRVSGRFRLASLLEIVKEELGRKLKAQVVEANLRAVRRGFEELQSESGV